MRNFERMLVVLQWWVEDGWIEDYPRVGRCLIDLMEAVKEELKNA